MPPLSAMYVNVHVTPRWWLSHAIRWGGWLVAFVGRFSTRGADLVARPLVSLCVRYGYLTVVHR